MRDRFRVRRLRHALAWVEDDDLGYLASKLSKIRPEDARKAGGGDEPATGGGPSATSDRGRYEIPPGTHPKVAAWVRERELRAEALEGLSPELVQILRDPRIRIPRDREVDLALYVYDNVPSNTASAMTVDDWRQAWLSQWQRANRAEMDVEELREALLGLYAAAEESALAEHEHDADALAVSNRLIRARAQAKAVLCALTQATPSPPRSTP